MRLFIAIDLDEAVRAALAAEQSGLQKAIGDRSALAWVRTDRMHLTLVFLGEVAEERATSLAEAIEQPIGLRAFEARFGGIGMFPPNGAPRVLWAGVASGAREFVALQHALADRVRRLGVSIEDRAFRPHLTLARWRESRTSDRGRVLAASKAATAIAPLRVDHATLYRSRPSPAGSCYTALARATLTSS